MALKEMPKVGDVVRCLFQDRYTTKGEEYEVFGIAKCGDALIVDDGGDIADPYYISRDLFWRFELMSERPSQEQSPQDPLDLIANLARRVTQLERDLNTSRRDIEIWAQETEKARISADTTESNLDDLANRQRDYLRRLNDTDAKVEMCIDDIVTLDERTRRERMRDEYNLFLDCMRKWYEEQSR